MRIADILVKADGVTVPLDITPNYTSLLVVYEGEAVLNDTVVSSGDTVCFDTSSGVKVADLLSTKPLRLLKLEA